MSYTSFDYRSYLQNYPDLKEAGIDNCEKAWTHYQRFGKAEGRIYQSTFAVKLHTVLYKNCSDLVIDYSDTYLFQYNGELIKMYSSTPCITETDDGYILNVRYLNYIIKEYEPVYTYSLNKYIKLDKSFMKVSEHFHTYDFRGDILKHRGLEDIKIFNDSGTFYYIGIIFKYKKSCITSGCYTPGTEFKLNIMQTTFNKNLEWEKNWCFVKYQNKVCIVYSWSPLRVCDLNYVLKNITIVKECHLPSVFENVRGSTNGYIFGDEIWFVAHINIKGEYYHLFVIFDLDMNIKRYSDFFKFENYTIEFCLGLVILPNSTIVVSYSTNDSTTKIMIIKTLSLHFTPI